MIVLLGVFAAIILIGVLAALWFLLCLCGLNVWAALILAIIFVAIGSVILTAWVEKEMRYATKHTAWLKEILLRNPTLRTANVDHIDRYHVDPDNTDDDI